MSERFDLVTGRVIAGKYEIVSLLGAGWEGEVYRVRERGTDIERAAKLFYPQRNPGNRTARNYAGRLHRLRHCPVMIQYHTEETLVIRKQKIAALISEYVEGELLTEFLARQRGGRLQPFQAVHLLHSLVQGIQCIHSHGEYHGDLHDENVIVSRYGLHFELKLLDALEQKGSRREHMHHDVIEAIRLFHESLGGPRFYARQPAVVKAICLGLKHTLIRKRFPTATHLLSHLENIEW